MRICDHCRNTDGKQVETLFVSFTYASQVRVSNPDGGELQVDLCGVCYRAAERDIKNLIVHYKTEKPRVAKE